MKFVRSTIGYMLAGMLVMSIWGGVLNGEFGTLGGILAGFFIIGLAWFVNHFLGLIHHAPTSGFIDLGLGVGMTGIFRDMWVSVLTNGTITPLTDALPTLALVVVGGVIGGIIAAIVERDMNRDKEVNA
ncbi:MAG: hypothetical protein GX760_04955 [Erysipelothrix sp.]|nr:hypothetical protein [Erysipelothrix sp.]